MADIGKTITASQPVYTLGYTRFEGRIDLPKIAGDDKVKQGRFVMIDTSDKNLVKGDLTGVNSTSELRIAYISRYNDNGVIGLGFPKGLPLKAVEKGFFGIIIDQETVNYGDKVYVDEHGTIKASSSPISAIAGTLTFANADGTYTNYTSISSGDLSLKVDGVAKNLTNLNFSSANSMTDVASVITSALSGSATASYSSETGLVITSATTGSTSTVEFVSSTALSSLLGTGVSVAGSNNMVDTGWVVETPNINGDKVSEIKKI